MNNKPLVSVIIPCYNHAKYIGHALDAMLAQTYKNIEIIIVDDYSTDNIDEVVEPYLSDHKHIQLVKNKFGSSEKQAAFYGTKNTDSGYAARNYGVSLAKGEYITFQDADDGSCANRIEVQMQLMKKYKAMHVVVGWQPFSLEKNKTICDVNIDTVSVLQGDDIEVLVKKTGKGIFSYPFSPKEQKNSIVRFFYKLERKFVRQWDPFPGAGSMPLVYKDVFTKCKFRPLYKRARPSLRGRGADRDFNYLVAEVYKKTVVAKVPLVLWRV